ncbi:MAG TPA: hypothetical protein DCY79_16170, partial [Planctomycetaceae bacterium]|nr:hypothetical protein [Planctomycetaceae bacterium]
MTSLATLALTQKIQQACHQNLTAITSAMEACWHEEVHLHCGDIHPCQPTELPQDPHYAIALGNTETGMLVLLPTLHAEGTKLDLAAAHRIYAVAESFRTALSPDETSWSDLRVGLVEDLADRLGSRADTNSLHRFDLRFRLHGRVLHVPMLAPLEHPMSVFTRTSDRDPVAETKPVA